MFLLYEELNTLQTKPAHGSANRSVYIMNMQYFSLPLCVYGSVCMCVCSKAKSSFPPLMITGTIDCNADEQASSARGVQQNLDMFKALTFMFFYAVMKLNSDVGGSWLSLRKHDVKQRACSVKVNCASASHPRTTRSDQPGGLSDITFRTHLFAHRLLNHPPSTPTS